VTAQTSPQPAASSRLGSVVQGVLTGAMGAAYAFIVGAAVYYLIQMAQAGISVYGWFVLLLPVIVPMLIFVVALVVARRRTIGAFLFVMLAGLGVSAVFWLDTLSYALRNGASLLG